MPQSRFGIIAEAAVNGRGLDNGAARRDQPVKALGKRHAANIARFGTALAGQLDHLKLFAHHIQVEFRGQRQQALLVQMDERAQEAPGATEENYANIDTLTALDPRHNADDGVIIRAVLWHEAPPLQKPVMLAGEPASRPDRPRAAPPGRASSRESR